jgi:two-component system, response regulator
MVFTNKISNSILIVEDSEDDFYITERTFSKAGLMNSLVRAKTGDEALDFLFCRGAYSYNTPENLPGIILLDLQLPGLSGREVLSEIKANPKLKKIPVVVLSGSDDSEDIDMCYQAGANGYITKPVNVENFIQAIARLQDYWFQINVLPKR